MLHWAKATSLTIETLLSSRSLTVGLVEGLCELARDADAVRRASGI